MYRVGAGCLRGLEDEIAAQVGLSWGVARQPDRKISVMNEGRSRIGVAEDGDRRDPHLTRCPEDTARDLAAVGHEDASDGRHRNYIRKTPKPRRPLTGLLCATDSDIPSTVRVSRGSMI